MRPCSQRTSQDTRFIVFSSILIVLAVLNFYLAGTLARKNQNIILNLIDIPPIQYAASTLLLVNAAVGLSAGITGLNRLYGAEIGLTIIGIIYSLTAGGYTIDHGLVQKYYSVCNPVYCRYHIWPEGYCLNMGLVAVNSFTLIFLTILSIDGCVSVSKRTKNHPLHQKHLVTTVVHTDEPHLNGSFQVPQELSQSYPAETSPQCFHLSELQPGYAVETSPQGYSMQGLPGVYVSRVAPQDYVLDANSYESSRRTTKRTIEI